MSSNTDSYKRAIDILMAGEFDARSVAIELAKNYPTIFVRLADTVEKIEPWMKGARAYIVSGQKVEAIKAIRNATSLGLKEAKDIADNCQNLLLTYNPQLSYYDGAAVLQDKQHKSWMRGIVKC